MFALFFVAVFGPGALAGTLAIAFHSIGFVGRLFSEALESTSPGPIEALRAAGAPAASVISFGYWPQVVPAYPITPQTHIVEGVGAMVKAGQLTGCEFITVEFPAAIAPERIVCITGEVVAQERKHVGFGVRFNELNQEQAMLIARLLEQSPVIKDRRG